MSESDCPNRTYYFDVGTGRWRGAFDFRVTDWRTFLTAPVGVLNRVLVVALVLAVRPLGAATMTSEVEAHPGRGEAGVATNDVRISKFGVTLYTFHEEYVLDPNCRDVVVVTEGRYGPIPGLFTHETAYPAEISAGPRATYRLPLLGADWVGKYEPAEDGSRVEAELTSDWAVASETIHRVE